MAGHPIQDTVQKISLIPGYKLYGLLFFALFSSISLGFLILGIILGWQMRTEPTTIPNAPQTNKVKESNPSGVSSREMITLEKDYFLVRDKEDFILSRRQGKNLIIERVMRLSYAPQRFPQDPKKLTFHGYYWDDVTVSKRQKLVEKKKIFESLKPLPLYAVRFTVQANKLAEEIADLGGIIYLMGFLVQESYPRLRKAASMSLGNRKYHKAAPVLLEFLAKEKSLEGMRQLVASLEKVTGQKLNPKEGKPNKEEVARKVEEWLKKHNIK